MIITKQYNDELLSTVSMRCGDSQYKDFSRSIYAQAIFDAQRYVIKKYTLLERTLEFIVREEETGEIQIGATNFKAESLFLVNGVEYNKRRKERLEEVLDKTTYYVRYDDTFGFVFDYYNKKAGDNVVIYYVSHGPISEESDGNLIVPDVYYDELIRASIINVAKIGIATFRAEAKDKYKDLYRLYAKGEEDATLQKDRDWIQIKPFKYP